MTAVTSVSPLGFFSTKISGHARKIRRVVKRQIVEICFPAHEGGKFCVLAGSGVETGLIPPTTRKRHIPRATGRQIHIRVVKKGIKQRLRECKSVTGYFRLRQRRIRFDEIFFKFLREIMHIRPKFRNLLVETGL